MPAQREASWTAAALRRFSLSEPHSLNFCFLQWILTIALLLAVSTAPAQEPLSGNYFAHDPSTLIKDITTGRYYYFRTDQGISINWSTDLRNWNGGGRVFPGNPPSWTTNAVPSFTGFFWAPDIAYFNGRYNLYYSISSWGTIDSAIGLVTTPSLSSPTWTDQGKVIQSDATWEAGPDTDLTSFNCIDPNILMDTNGTIWMAFGSYSDGILVMQLDPVTGKRLNTNTPPVKIANNGPSFFSNTTEASCLHQRGGFYYLFLNFGGCCSGVDSTYNIRVGRSSSVTGPYLDRNGINMLNGGGTILLESTGRFIGPGHTGILTENGTNWFTYHYYDGNDNGNARLGLARLEWAADGWPVLTNDWSALYTFDVDAREHRALYNGTLQNGAVITNDSAIGKVLSLESTSSLVRLPLSVANASTFAAWVKWNGGNDWQRIFDFGSNNTRYFFLTPRNGQNGRMRFAIKTSSSSEQILDAPAALPTNSWCHVAVALDGARGVMFLNGEPIATNLAMNLRPWQVLARDNFLGESQFPIDPIFNGRIDSFRVFSRALNAAEVKQVAWANHSLAHRYRFATSNAWDSIGMAHGRLYGNAVVTNGALKLSGATGGYANLPGGLVSGSSAVTVEFWASFGANGTWARVFDFGNISGTVGQNYFFFSPHTGTGSHRMETGTTAVVPLDIPGSFDDRTLYVACVVEPATGFGAIYTNGILERAVTNTWPVFTGVSTAWSFIGRSLFSGDAWLNATIAELRIYDSRLTPDEISANFAAGPEILHQSVQLTMTKTPGGYAFNWPSYAPGFVVESNGSLAGLNAWSPLGGAPVISNGLYRLSAPTLSPNSFYRLRRPGE